MDDRTLRENAIDFINYKRSLGYTYEGQEYVLNRYVTFAETRISSSIPVKCITEEFLSALADAPGTLYIKRHLSSVNSADICWYEALKRHMCFPLK